MSTKSCDKQTIEALRACLYVAKHELEEMIEDLKNHGRAYDITQKVLADVIIALKSTEPR